MYVFQDKACEAMEILDELIECEVGLIVPYINSIVQVCLEVRTHVTKILFMVQESSKVVLSSFTNILL